MQLLSKDGTVISGSGNLGVARATIPQGRPYECYTAFLTVGGLGNFSNGTPIEMGFTIVDDHGGLAGVGSGRASTDAGRPSENSTAPTPRPGGSAPRG